MPELLKGQAAVSVSAPDDTILTATGLQVAGVLDDLYANDEPLGIVWGQGQPTLRLWAPTAQSVRLHLYPDSAAGSTSRQLDMAFDPETGIWEVQGEADWLGLYYLYEVNVYVRQEGRAVQNMVTDPYSLSLAINSTRSQIVDLGSQDLQPAGWEQMSKPALDDPADIVLYELHIRDFSIFDESLPIEERGTYLAFTHPESTGMQHLARLAQAGVTHLHLLPAFDIATINEDKSTWQTSITSTWPACRPTPRNSRPS